MATIQKVANELNVTPNTLRYYEKVGIIDPISRDKNGVHHYNDDNIERTRMAIILRNMGMPVKDVREQMHQMGDDPTIDEMYAFRETIQSLMDDLEKKSQQIEDEKKHVRNKLIIVDEQIRRKQQKTVSA